MFIAIYWVNLKVANQQKTLHRRNPAFAGLFIHAPEAIRTPDARFRKAIMFVEISTVYVSGGAVGSSFFKHF